ncbi:MmpS family transport accessory protein [Mycobacterium pseudoshottsii]|uniref:MmpS family transport accessory protein n=1 Tax=Mycobacterium pseudoshottsii TaxID=265949 RepID=UPI003555D0EB
MLERQAADGIDHLHAALVGVPGRFRGEPNAPCSRTTTAASNADSIVAFNPKRVLYEVTGPPGSLATINYLDAEAQPHEVTNTAIPWSLTVVTTLSAVIANVVARSDSTSLGCRITVNGVVRAEREVESYNAHTSCLVKSA